MKQKCKNEQYSKFYTLFKNCHNHLELKLHKCILTFLKMCENCKLLKGLRNFEFWIIPTYDKK